MVKLDSLNESAPREILQRGTLDGAANGLDLTSIQDHLHSRAATLLKAHSSKHGVLALKVVFSPDVRLPHDLRREVRIMAGLKHANVCSLLNAYLIDSHYVLVMPFYEKTLDGILDDPAFIPSGPSSSSFSFETTAKSMIRQMCSAVAYLHDETVAHRDLSPNNWLVSASGSVALTDFGVAWTPNSQEGSANLAFELGSGPYRAPELLFGSRTYDPFALDQWSLGVCISSFFAPIGPVRAPTPDSDEEEDRPAWQTITARSAGPTQRSAIFDGWFSDFAMIGSIFRIRGTPTMDSWPEAKSLPDFGKFTYKQFPEQDLRAVLPNLPADDTVVDLISGMLQYPFEKRLSPKHALRHSWLQDSAQS